VDSTGYRSHILLAEDNPGDVGLVREALQEHGVDCKLQVLADGEAACAFIDRLNLDASLRCPDLFLLDLHLPKRDGTQILEHLRASKRCGETPVVVLTAADAIALGSGTDRHKAYESATVQYFQKPVSLNEFLQLGRIVKEIMARAPAV
jgi:CheY-like chemotaxis protein